jgi:hypothetical protein
MPPLIDWDGADIEADADVHPSLSNGGYFLVASFARSSLRQTGDGHFIALCCMTSDRDILAVRADAAGMRIGVGRGRSE